MTGVDVSALLRLPVRVHGIHLGRPVDLILDPDLRRALGLEVHCGDEIRRFLPLAVADVRDDAIEISSSLLMLDESELRFYSERGATFRSIRGSTVVRDGRVFGAAVGLRLGPEWVIDELDVATAEGTSTIPYDERVLFAPAGSAARVAS